MKRRLSFLSIPIIEDKIGLDSLVKATEKLSIMIEPWLLAWLLASYEYLEP